MGEGKGEGEKDKAREIERERWKDRKRADRLKEEKGGEQRIRREHYSSQCARHNRGVKYL